MISLGREDRERFVEIVGRAALAFCRNRHQSEPRGKAGKDSGLAIAGALLRRTFAEDGGLGFMRCRRQLALAFDLENHSSNEPQVQAMKTRHSQSTAIQVMRITSKEQQPQRRIFTSIKRGSDGTQFRTDVNSSTRPTT